MRTWLLATTLGLMAVGCAAKRVRADVPTERLAESRAAIRTAEELGADRYPTAARHLAFARQQLGEAQRLMNLGEYEAADLQLQQAAADAQLAVALAREEPVEAEARRLTQQVRALRQEQQ